MANLVEVYSHSRPRGIMAPSNRRDTMSHVEKTEALKSAMKQAKYWSKRVEEIRDDCIEENIKSVESHDAAS